jgi:hypothetical protein
MRGGGGGGGLDQGDSPRRKLVGRLHIFHDLLQRLLVPDVHLIADVSLPIPVVDHGE